MNREAFLFRISETAFPGLKEGRFFCTFKGTEYYFSGLISREVKIIYRSFYDPFDFAFSIDCVFSVCDVKSDSRWIRKEGSRHIYSTPVLSVMERNRFDCDPETVLAKLTAKRVNVLVLDSCSWKPEQVNRLRDHLLHNGVCLIFRRELEEIASSTNSETLHKQVDVGVTKAKTGIARREKEGNMNPLMV